MKTQSKMIRVLLFSVVMSLLFSYSVKAQTETPSTPTDSETPNVISPDHATGEVRGVTFFYLDGKYQDFPWVLFHQDETGTKDKICEVFKAYTAAGVNWIRLLVAAWHFGSYQPDIYKQPQTYISKVNDFMAKTRSCSNAGPFLIEIVLDPRTSPTGYFTDYPPYNNDKAWLRTWLNGLNYTNLGMVLIAGDTMPCSWNGTTSFSCFGDSATTVSPLSYNHGHWIKEVFNTLRNEYPNTHINFEVIAGDLANNGELIKKLGAWVSSYTPGTWEMAASLYFELEDGKPWQDYANKTMLLLNAYHSVTTKPLWIDEYGMRICVNGNCDTPNNPNDDYTEADQQAYYDGFLGATTCWTTVDYPKFAWVASRDYPYNNNSHFGLISSFSGNVPVWRPAWNTVRTYYNLQTCP